MVSKKSTVLILLLALVAASNALDRSHLRAKVSDLRVEVGGDHRVYPGSVIALKGGRDNKYCTDEGYAGIKCNRGAAGCPLGAPRTAEGPCKDLDGSLGQALYEPDRHQLFYVETATGNSATLKSDRHGIAMYTVQLLGGGRLALKKNNKYCADEGGNGINCNRGGVGGWEKFKIMEHVEGSWGAWSSNPNEVKP